MAVIEVEGTKVAYAEAGRGEPIVLLHCTGGSGAQWQALMAELASRYRVVAPDLYGHGGTDPWPGEAPLTLGAEAALVEAVAGRDDRVHLVGHSYGGAVALRAALERPGRVATLTLIEPVAFHLLANDNLADELLFAEVEEVAAAVRRAAATGDHASGLERFVDYWNGPGSWARIRPELRRALMPRIGTIATNFSATMSEPTPVAACERLTMPTLVLSGSHSTAPVRRIARLLADAIPHAAHRVVEGAGHMLPFSHKDAVHAAIRAHLGIAADGLPEAA